MAQPLQSISLLAPAFKGLNTQESPIQLDPSFATVADNCVIDKSGRLAARKGREVVTTNPSILNSNYTTAMMEFVDNTGAATMLSAGDGKLFSGTTTLTDITPAAYTPTADDWQIVSFNNAAYFFQAGHEPLQYSAGTLQTFTAAGSTGTVPHGNAALAAYGRLWVADVDNDGHTLYWSDLLNGLTWTGGGGSAGSLNLRTVWPRGYDEVVALAAHNDFLLIFGKESILVYQGAEDPATMELVDTIVDIGCVARDTVKIIGTDVLFLSQEGVRSLGRTIQEKSVGIGDISANIKDDLLSYIGSGGECAAYSAYDNLYVVSFPNSSTCFAFDTRGRLENGAMRATRWTIVEHRSYYVAQDGTFYIGTDEGICRYDTYLDDADSYNMQYESPMLAFGDDSRLKFLKRIRAILTGGTTGSQAVLRWSYGLGGSFTSRTVPLTGSAAGVSYFGEGEYNIAEFSAGIEQANTKISINGNGSGESITFGVTATITGSELGIQSINLQTLIGKYI